MGHLKAGSYTVQGGTARKFKRVGLVGHSAAGQISITEAYTYADLKALVVVGFSYSNLPRGNDEFGFQRIACDAGGDPVTGLVNYGFFGRTEAGFRSTMFRSAPKAVQDAGGQAALPRPLWRQLLTDRHDPEAGRECPQGQGAGAGRLRHARTCCTPPFGCEAQAERFRKGRSLILRNTGHGVPLERSAKTFRKRLSRFLDRSGLVARSAILRGGHDSAVRTIHRSPPISVLILS